MLHRLSKVQALAVLSSDALSSVAYGTEETLLVLVTAGTAALGLSLPIALAIAVLLLLVAISYYQTIHAYPLGGGAYTVAHENLGVLPGLVAASALLTAYVLTVAVSTAAGVAALTSAFPALSPYRTALCVLSIALVAWANLRGVRESGKLFAVPTYAFVAVFLGLIGIGLFRLGTGTLPVSAGAGLDAGVPRPQAASLFVVLRAFAAGCVALTGVEAISNGIPIFRRPESDNAGKTLIAMAVLLGAMFLGITVLAFGLRAVPVEQETLVSQIGRRVFAGRALYLALQATTALILLLAANTSFAGFPRLAAILASDRYLPNQLTHRGDRLVFNSGIIALAVVASGLVIVFGGETHRLIPLYAVGVFLSFTLSQAGMVQHWRRARGQEWLWKVIVNGLGAIATGIVLAVVIVTRFVEGAWIVTVLIPLFVLMFAVIRGHYRDVADQLSLQRLDPSEWRGLWHLKDPKVVVPIASLHQGTLTALRFACGLSADVTATIVDVDPQTTARTQERWPAWGQGLPLVVLESPYRATIAPLLQYMEEVDRRDPERGQAIVVLPEFVPARWWHRFLHNQTALLLRAALTSQSGEGTEGRVVINVPYRLAR